MSELIKILIFSWLAGVMAFIGGFISRLEGSMETEKKQEMVHAIVAFGGGILLSAIAFTLVPEAMNDLSPNLMFITLCIGGIFFSIIDYLISKSGHSKAQFMAMLMDFIPESLVLGVVWIHNPHLGALLALFIGLQNLPEGFNAFRELNEGNSRNTLINLFLISFLGPIFALLGFFVLKDSVFITSLILAFASGGILYLIFEDIAPASVMLKHRSPPLGAVLGFAVGVFAKQLLY